MIPKTIYTYWEGPMWPYVKKCLETFGTSGCEVKALAPETLFEYLVPGEYLSNGVFRLTNLAQKVDCLRLAILYKYGGMWCDADTVFIKNCEHLFKPDADFIGLRWTGSGRLLNGTFFCKPKSVFVEKCLDMINAVLDGERKFYYSSQSGCCFGEDIFNEVNNKNPGLFTEYDNKIFLPIDIPNNPQLWETECDVREYVTAQTVAIGLNNSHYSPRLKNMEVEDMIAEGMLLGSVFEYYNKCKNSLKHKDVTAVYDMNKGWNDSFAISSIESVYEYVGKIIVVNYKSKKLLESWKKKHDGAGKIDLVPGQRKVDGVALLLTFEMVWDDNSLIELYNAFQDNPGIEYLLCSSRFFIKTPWHYFKKSPISACLRNSNGHGTFTVEGVFVSNYRYVRTSLHAVLDMMRVANIENWVDEYWNKIDMCDSITMDKDKMPKRLGSNALCGAWKTDPKGTEKPIEVSSEDLKKFGLPADFDANHIFYKVPSYYQKYEMLLGRRRNTIYGGKDVKPV